MKLYIWTVTTGEITVTLDTGKFPSWTSNESVKTSVLIEYLLDEIPLDNYTSLSVDITGKNVNEVANAIKVSTSLSHIAINCTKYISPISSEYMLTLIDSLRNKSTITQVNIDGYLGSEVFGWAFEVFTTLPLTSISVGTRPGRIHLKVEDALRLHEIKTLKIIEYTIFGWRNQDYALFLSKMLEIVSVLKIRHMIRREEMKVLALALSTNITPVEILHLSIDQGTDLLGEALKTNTRLKSLEVQALLDYEARTIFEGLTHNDSLLKLKTHVRTGDHLFLMHMLKTNTMIEDLEITVSYNAPTSHELISALANSTLVKLEFKTGGLPDMTEYVDSFLDAFRTNTTLTHLSLTVSHANIDAEHVVELLTQNSTLEVLKLENVSIMYASKLEPIWSNETLTEVWPGAPSLLRQVAERNKRNKSMRHASLFGLTSHIMY